MKRKHVSMLLGDVIVSLPLVASAQVDRGIPSAIVDQLVGTTEVIFHRSTSEGQLEACGLEFSAIGRDLGNNGRLYKLNGSYYLRTNHKDMHVLVKLGVWDFEQDLTLPPRSFAPPKAYVSARNKPMAKPVTSFASDNPAYSLHMFQLDEQLQTVWASIFDQQQLDVSFSRGRNRQDVTTTVDLRIKASRSDGGGIVRETSQDMLVSFGECTSQLIKGFEAQLAPSSGKR